MNSEFFHSTISDWRSLIEILLLAVCIYYSYLGMRGTRGARVLTGLMMLVLGLSLLSQVLGLEVIGWLIRSLSAVLILALVVIFQPELRRLLAELGSHRLLAGQTQSRESIQVLVETAFDLSDRHCGALIALERGTDIQSHIESGVELDAKFSLELIVTIFHPKTPLHDGGVIIRNDRVLSAACIFPVSQRQDLDRNLGLRHRAAIGLTEESDAVVVVVSEETGRVSICHRGKVERDFTPETLRRRMAQLLSTHDQETAHEQPSGQTAVAAPGGDALDSHQKEPVDHKNLAA
jgi:diadenylate cyclase